MQQANGSINNNGTPPFSHPSSPPMTIPGCVPSSSHSSNARSNKFDLANGTHGHVHTNTDTQPQTQTASLPATWSNGTFKLEAFHPFSQYAASSTQSNNTSPPLFPSSSSSSTFAVDGSGSSMSPQASTMHASAPPVTEQPSHGLPLSRSFPVSIPAFRRAVSFVGMDQGFDLFGPQLEESPRGKQNTQTSHQHHQQQQPFSSANQSQAQAQPQPRLGALSMQLKQQQHQSAAASSTHTAAAMSTVAAAAPHSSSALPSTISSTAPSTQLHRIPSTVSMSDAEDIPEISSPPPSTAAEFEFQFDSPSPPADTNPPNPAQRQILNFDLVHVNARDQVLGAIPHVRSTSWQQRAALNKRQEEQQRRSPYRGPAPLPVEPPQPLPATSTSSVASVSSGVPSRWSPALSSSAPSHLPSFMSIRQDSAGGNSSVGSSNHASKRPSLLGAAGFQAHRSSDGAHTPTTVCSEDQTSGAQGWSPSGVNDDDDEFTIDDAELDARISHTVHGDASSCSLSPCSSCSSESDDYAADLDADLDLSLTFADRNNEEEDEVQRALHDRLNQSKRAHHAERHLVHRRRRMRAQLKREHDDAKAKAAAAAAAEDQSQPFNEADVITLGSYTKAERARKIQRFLEKRQRRVWGKKILYTCRKNFADKRPRVGGRFVKLRDDSSPVAAALPGRGHSLSLSSSPITPAMMAQVGVGGSNDDHDHMPLAFSLPAAGYYTQGFSSSSPLSERERASSVMSAAAPASVSASTNTASASPAAACMIDPSLTMPMPSPTPASLGVLSFLKQEPMTMTMTMPIHSQTIHSNTRPRSSGLTAALAHPTRNLMQTPK